MDPAPLILVWRRKLGGDELLELADGKGWRLPCVDEIGLPRADIDGAIPHLAEAPRDFDPGRMHRWVRIDDAGPEVRGAFAQSGASAIVWRRGAGGPEVLLLHRAVHGPDYEGDWAWCPPGGGLDPGETHAECARRELHEETGLALELTRLAIGNGFAAHIAELTLEQEIVLSAEHDRYEWVPIDDALGRCAPEAVVDTLRVARDHIGWGE